MVYSAVSEDAILVNRARAGDNDAFGELVRRHERRAYALACSLVGDVTEAEDLTQEAFLRALRNLDLLADAEKFGPWLHRVVFGTCIDWLRRFRPELVQSSMANDEHFMNAPASEPTAWHAIEHNELVARVMTAMAALPDRYRVPLTMYHLDGLDHARVAAALGVPVSTVRSLVLRARRKLAALLSDMRDDAEAGAASVFDSQPSEPRAMLHILNGDATRMSLEVSGVPGAISVWGDVLYEGPVPRDVDDATFREVRARFHSDDPASYAEALAMHERWDRGLDSAATADEVVLWFEHDLHDQMLLVRQLDWFARQPARPYTLSLICIGEFPAVVPFHGLGQLTPDQLASLLDTRQRVTERQLALGQAMWRAFTGDDPSAMERLLARDTSSLPFLAGAMRRLFEDFPDSITGLPRTERTILEILRRDGDMRFINLFPLQQKTEERVFMGDLTFGARLKDLAGGPRPLIRIDGSKIAITENGRRVLAGTLDWMTVAEFDRWIGGTRLVPPNIPWRWNASSQQLVASSSLRAPRPVRQD